MTTQASSISATMVKELREKTGAGLMDAKNALVEAKGDMEKAVEVLRQKGALTAEKKSGRATAEGLIRAEISLDGKDGILLEVNCETDFVARGDAFQELTATLSKRALASQATTLTELLAEKLSAKSKQTLEDYLKENVGVIKENLKLRRFCRYQVRNHGMVHAYIHTGSKIGVLLQVETDSDKPLKSAAFGQLVKDLGMHIASSAPEFLSRQEIPPAVIEAEKRIEMGKEDLQKKPPEIREKIVMGRVDKILAQRVLLEQPFVKDPSKTIQALIDETAAALKADVTLTAFERYLLGEGEEKRQDNFAQEVMSQIKS